MISIFAEISAKLVQINIIVDSQLHGFIIDPLRDPKEFPRNEFLISIVLEVIMDPEKIIMFSKTFDVMSNYLWILMMRERETDRQTDRQRKGQRDREERDRQKDRQTNRQSEREREGERERGEGKREKRTVAWLYWGLTPL